MSLPVGLASPLWLAFGAAASIGATWWWMTRWTAAANQPSVTPSAKVAEPVKTVVEPVIEPVIEALAAAPVVVEAVVKETVSAADDLTQLVGIGPKLADALAARGVTQFAQLASWSDKELARFDAELNLRGRAVRNEWVAQAKRMAAVA